MRLRTLKKWSKQAAPILKQYNLTDKEHFLSERGENYHGFVISCRCPRRRRKTKEGYPLSCECQYHPLKCTPMVGEMSGYYEPEWDEKTAWDELHEFVLWNDRPKHIPHDEWVRIMRVARVTVADQDRITEILERQAREMREGFHYGQ